MLGRMLALPVKKLQGFFVILGVAIILLSLYAHFKLAPGLESKLRAEMAALEDAELKWKSMNTEIDASQSRMDKAGSRDVGTAFVTAHEEMTTTIIPLENKLQELSVKVDSSQKTVRRLLFQLRGIQVLEALGIIAAILLAGFGFLRAKSI